MSRKRKWGSGKRFYEELIETFSKQSEFHEPVRPEAETDGQSVHVDLPQEAGPLIETEQTDFQR